MKEENLTEIVREDEPLSVLFETREGDIMIGHSAEFAEVHVKTERELHGELCRVLPLSAENGVIMGALLED